MKPQMQVVLGHFYFAKLRKCSFSAILWPIGLGRKKKKTRQKLQRELPLSQPSLGPRSSSAPLALKPSPLPHPKDNINPTTAPSWAEQGDLGHHLVLWSISLLVLHPQSILALLQGRGHPLRPGKLIPCVPGWVAGAPLPVLGAWVRFFPWCRGGKLPAEQGSGGFRLLLHPPLSAPLSGKAPD